jgi:hypothetical protein
MLLRAASFACLVTLLASAPVRADEHDLKAASAPAESVAAAVTTTEAAPALPSWVVPSRHEKRPAALVALYGTYGALAIADLTSSKKAFAAGGHEGNPLMGSGHTSRMVLVKGAGAALSIYFAERMWKKNKVGAIITMAVVNSISASVVAHNVGIAKR